MIHWTPLVVVAIVEELPPTCGRQPPVDELLTVAREDRASDG
jgi:hypothetical protein